MLCSSRIIKQRHAGVVTTWLQVSNSHLWCSCILLQKWRDIWNYFLWQKIFFTNRTTQLVAETNPGITPGGSLPFDPILRKRRHIRQNLKSQMPKKWPLSWPHQEPTCLIATGILSSKQSLAKAPEPSFGRLHLGEFWHSAEEFFVVIF